MLTGAFFMLQVYDRVLPSRSVATLIALIILVAVLFAFLAILDMLRNRVLTRIGASLDDALSARVYDAIVRLPLRTGSRGDGLQPLRDLDAVRAFLSGPGQTALFDLPWLPLYLAIIFAFHVALGIAALIGAIVLMTLTLTTEVLARKPMRAATSFAQARTGLAEASRRNAEVLAAMGMAGRLNARWNEANQSYLASHQRVSDIAGGFGSISKALRMMLQSTVLGIGAYLVISQVATAGIIIAASILVARALAPVDLAIANWKGFVAARQSWKRLTQLLERLPALEAPMTLPSPTTSLTVDHASAVPPGQQKVVVHDVSFNLQSGQGLGIIGPSGSGKSSLVRMIVGAWRAARGRIRLDGAALDQWSPEELGRHIGYLPQDVELFAGTVVENIARFEPDPASEDIIGAAQAAGVHDLIVGLPQGYETEIGEQGQVLSAGQRQRIALARALYREPFLIVLDEPNSNLDAEGETALTQAILGVRNRGGIIVVVAHRPSALAGVDLVLVMANGSAASFGSKDEVLAKVLTQRSSNSTSTTHRGSRGGGAVVTKQPRSAPLSSIRNHQMMGLVVVAVLAGGVGSWAATTDISGAVIAPGVIVVDSYVKKVQHPTGGIVGEILARDGDRVKAGDVVVRLDDTVTRANLAIITKGLTELWARKARLTAERDGSGTINVPDELAEHGSEPQVAEVIAGEQRLFDLRKTARNGQKEQLRQQIVQLKEEIEGLGVQADAKAREIELIQRELNGVRELWEKNLIPITRLTTLEREATRVEGEKGNLISTIARAKAKVAETELQIIQIDQDLASEVAKELRDTEAKIGEFVERKVAAKDQLKRIDIRAPQSGVVHQSTVHTLGGVIDAGKLIMLVVPEGDHLTVDAKVNPKDIDQLILGQEAMLRFSAFNVRTTPQLNGTVSEISPDITTDERKGTSYYTIRVALSAKEIARLGNKTLMPGMPVEVFVKTGDRRVLSYLVKPLSDQISRAFREQ